MLKIALLNDCIFSPEMYKCYIVRQEIIHIKSHFFFLLSTKPSSISQSSLQSGVAKDLVLVTWVEEMFGPLKFPWPKSETPPFSFPSSSCMESPRRTLNRVELQDERDEAYWMTLSELHDQQHVPWTGTRTINEFTWYWATEIMSFCFNWYYYILPSSTFPSIRFIVLSILILTSNHTDVSFVPICIYVY